MSDILPEDEIPKFKVGDFVIYRYHVLPYGNSAELPIDFETRCVIVDGTNTIDPDFRYYTIRKLDGLSIPISQVPEFKLRPMSDLEAIVTEAIYVSGE